MFRSLELGLASISMVVADRLALVIGLQFKYLSTVSIGCILTVF
jgi:hypothetical protein